MPKKEAKAHVGRPARTRNGAAVYMLNCKLDERERRELERYAAKMKLPLSGIVREALIQIGAIKRAKPPA